MGLPPLHRLDNPIEFIHPIYDDAWDIERINDSLDDEYAGRELEHPFVLYRSGETRYDLSAGDVRAWLKPDVKPCIFQLKRLGRSDRFMLKTMERRNQDEFAAEYAFRRGLLAITDGDENIPLRGVKGTRVLLTDADVKLFEDRFGADMLVEVGQAIRNASADLHEAEKKQSA